MQAKPQTDSVFLNERTHLVDWQRVVRGVVDPVAHHLPVGFLGLVPVDDCRGRAQHATSDLQGGENKSNLSRAAQMQRRDVKATLLCITHTKYPMSKKSLYGIFVLSQPKTYLPGRRGGGLLSCAGLHHLAGGALANCVDGRHPKVVVGVRAEAAHAVARGGDAIDLLVGVLGPSCTVLEEAREDLFNNTHV